METDTVDQIIVLYMQCFKVKGPDIYILPLTGNPNSSGLLF